MLRFFNTGSTKAMRNVAFLLAIILTAAIDSNEGLLAQEPQLKSLDVLPSGAAGVIVVRPADWSSALSVWKAYRQAQGHVIHEVDAEAGAQQAQATIAQIAASARNQHQTTPATPEIGYVLLVGDADMGPEAPLLPAWYRTSEAMAKLGGDKVLATDNPYADIDHDEKPDLAVGRIPADTPEALSRYLERVMAYEKQLDYGLWRRDVRVVAGVGGFGALADTAIEMTTTRFLSDRVPAWCDVSMTYASPNSPYCPDPFQFSSITREQLAAGSQFWVYIGHGHVKHLDYVRVEDESLQILDDSQIPRGDKHERPPIAVFLACYTGAFDAREDCLSEQLLMSPSGPVACIAATRVTGPYGLACLASGMLNECFVDRQETLGWAVMRAKRDMLRPDPPLDSDEARADFQMQMITGLASALSPPGHDLLQERLEHVWQLNLLGDPLLRLHHPANLDLHTQARIVQGESISVEGVTTQAGTVTVELTWPRDRSRGDLFKAGSFSSDTQVREKMQASYAKANDRVITSQTFEQTQAGKFDCQLSTAQPLKPGRYVVRVFVCGEKSCSAGSADITVVSRRGP